MHRTTFRLGIAIASLVSAYTAFAQSPAAPTASAAPNDYAKADSWLCRPGRQDACTVDLTTTIVAADGKLANEPYKANANAPIDCFYVYPTVSLDATPNSDMTAGPEEKNVILQQFARFGSQCKQFAPLYRQITLTALRSMIAGKPLEADRTLAYKDVVDAWNYYLEHDNNGRGVVLIGHSQGSGMLVRLIAEQTLRTRPRRRPSGRMHESSGACGRQRRAPCLLECDRAHDHLARSADGVGDGRGGEDAVRQRARIARRRVPVQRERHLPAGDDEKESVGSAHR
jgi:hypothetical protein